MGNWFQSVLTSLQGAELPHILDDTQGGGWEGCTDDAGASVRVCAAGSSRKYKLRRSAEFPPQSPLLSYERPRQPSPLPQSVCKKTESSQSYLRLCLTPHTF